MTPAPSQGDTKESLLFNSLINLHFCPHMKQIKIFIIQKEVYFVQNSKILIFLRFFIKSYFSSVCQVRSMKASSLPIFSTFSEYLLKISNIFALSSLKCYSETFYISLSLDSTYFVTNISFPLIS